MSNILVTGGAGFIGSNLTEALLDSGHSVRVLDNFATGKIENLLPLLEKHPDSLALQVGDIRNMEDCRKATKEIDYVFHEAALGSVPRSIKDPITSNEVNVSGFLNMLVASRDASTAIPSTMSETYTFTLEEGKIVSSDPSFVLQPFDQIIVRRSPSYDPQRNVTIEGEVLFEGQYAKETRNERLSSLVKRAGGLTEYAYVKGAKLRRRSTPEEIQRSRTALMTQARIESDSTFVNSIDLTMQYIGIDLEKALKRPGGDDDIILREGDILIIPQLTNTVKISGGVMYPNTVNYNKRMSLDSYIRQAGGYSRLAMKNKPFVIYMNGKVATGRWAKIEPGCEIVVPEKPDREPMSMQGILGISTSIASIALLISNLVK